MNTSTLTRKLFLRIAPVVIVTIVVVGAFAFNSATREIDNIYDAQLINDANVLWGLLQHKLKRPIGHVPQRIDDIDFNIDPSAFNDMAHRLVGRVLCLGRWVHVEVDVVDPLRHVTDRSLQLVLKQAPQHIRVVNQLGIVDVVDLTASRC